MRDRIASELALFFVCAYAISWLLWLPLIFGKSGLGILPLNLPIQYVAVGTVGPTLAALIAQKKYAGNWRAFRLWTSITAMARGMVAGSVFMLASCFAAAVWATQSGWTLWNWAALAQIATLFLPNLLGGPLFEEPGWRGFALPRLQQKFHPLPASIILGFLWASWHLPLFIVHFSSIPYWQYAPLMIAASIIIAFGVNVSRGSVLAAIYLHGLLNLGIGIIMNDFLGKAQIRKYPSEGAVIVMSFVLVAAVLAVLTRGRLGVRLIGSDMRPAVYKA